MGLDTTHDCWHGAYTAFNRWRSKLAEVAGYTESRNPDGTTHIDLDWGNIQSVIGDDLFGRWSRIPVRPDGTPDALIILLAHQDCEGTLQSEFCGALADRLEDLLPKLEGQDGGGHVGMYADSTVRFIAGLRRAAAAGEDVEFR